MNTIFYFREFNKFLGTTYYKSQKSYEKKKKKKEKNK